MATPRKTGHPSETTETWPIFIAYRDDDGRKHAEWLFRNLNRSPVPVTTSDASGPPVIDPFFDKNNPPTDDFTKYNQPNLERALALILVCTFGAAQPRLPTLVKTGCTAKSTGGSADAGASPLLIRASGKSPYVPLEIHRKWPLAQWVELDLDSLEALSDAERNEQAEQIVRPIRRGIADSRSGVVYEQLQQQKRIGFRLLVTTIIAGVLALSSVGLALWADNARRLANAETKRADEAAALAQAQARLAESRRLAALSDATRPERLDLAMLLALEAAKEADTLEARGSIQRSLDERPEVARFLHVPEGSVTSVAFGPDGKIAAGYGAESSKGGVVLFDAQDEHFRPAPLEVKEGNVTSVAFGPEGKIAAGYRAKSSRGGVVLFDARGKRFRLRPWRSRTAMSRAWLSGRRAKSQRDFGARASAHGGVAIFDARGGQLMSASLDVVEGYVTSVAFGPDAKIAAGYASQDGGGLALFDARGERLQPGALAVKEGYVTSVAVGPDGRIGAGWGGDADGGVVLFDASGERARTVPLVVKEGYVSGVAFGPDGKIAAGFAPTRPAAATVWCSSTGVASDSELRLLRSTRAT